jgi:hypothetical protein
MAQITTAELLMAIEVVMLFNGQAGKANFHIGQRPNSDTTLAKLVCN